MTLPSSAMTSRRNRPMRATGPRPARTADRVWVVVAASPRVWVTRSSPRSWSILSPAAQVAPRAQGRQDSNLQQPVLETGTLPIELRPSDAPGPAGNATGDTDPAHTGAGADAPQLRKCTALPPAPA